MKSLQYIETELKKHKQELVNNYHIKDIGIFGSYIRHEETENSDVDIIVDFSKPIDLFSFIRMRNYVSEIVGLKADVVTKKGLHPRIAERILKEAQYL